MSQISSIALKFELFRVMTCSVSCVNSSTKRHWITASDWHIRLLTPISHLKMASLDIEYCLKKCNWKQSLGGDRSHRSLIFSLCLEFLYAWHSLSNIFRFFLFQHKRTFRDKEWLSDLTHIFVALGNKIVQKSKMNSSGYRCDNFYLVEVKMWWSLVFFSHALEKAWATFFTLMICKK